VAVAVVSAQSVKILTVKALYEVVVDESCQSLRTLVQRLQRLEGGKGLMKKYKVVVSLDFLLD
jgi:hypothetical protein